MKSILKYLKLRFFTKYYFISGTLEHNGERKWFRMLYAPENGMVNELTAKSIFEKDNKITTKYFVITNFKRITAKEYLNF